MTRTLDSHPTLGRTGTQHSRPTFAARTVLRMLNKLSCGRLEVELPNGEMRRFGPGGQPHAALRLNNWNVFSAALKSGDIGFAESYIQGDWTTSDLTSLIALFIVNREQMERVLYGAWWGKLVYRMRHILNRNSRSGSRRNIHAHYDLGNAFYRYWLDETMNYSSAWFQDDRTQSLPQAQHAKVRRALDEAAVAAGDRVLEIGCGWGAVAHAAAQRGANVVGVTLSTEQLHYAQNRLDDAGYGERADLRLQDYRDIQDGPYDALISIEMFEAVGREYWPSFFETVRKNLKPGGRACIQSITIRDDLFDRYVKSTDFIQQYIFPGGMLPSEREFCNAAQRAGLRVENVLRFGPDYAETLRRWRAPFHANEPAIRAQGFDTVFMRTWDFYLSYCEAAFDTGNTNVVQFTLVNEAQEAA
ncbi:MAG: SAM-dependent methyltransferase [Alcaligenaceae bacterium]|jgi:cyclopropane-fatty-acyl-phospholipid synthase|uniref:SAM-dependent methyltransferase n=1 Tax=Neopusillimonas maritima TaxID=2026239 RepID=A0A3A1YVG6_9BURK|nr:cyclopropane-fatty-acyl-phospholipid synthase family protein [Neopusillimonas maritima]MAL02275.1 SAM-dependent methyltransferase [Alcaligenaceae bacterium]RIY41279.1 SAM-dependent methyltransferase [Neopusillimonas maritima]